MPLIDNSDVVHLEKRLRELESQLRRASTFSSTDIPTDFASMQIDASSSQLESLVQVDSAVSSSSGTDSEASRTLSKNASSEVAVETLGSVFQQEPGSPFDPEDKVPKYRGRSTGVEILRNLRQLCDSFIGLGLDSEDPALKMVDALDASFPTPEASLVSLANVCFSSEISMNRWVDLAFNEAFTLWPFIDREAFDKHLQRLFRQALHQRDEYNIDHLGLIHAVIACGQRHDPNLWNLESHSTNSQGFPGIQHFEAARHLVPVADCSRSLTAVQTTLCLAIYAKSVSAQRTVHTYVSMAGFAAHQLGLHQAASARRLPTRERIVRQRVYTVVRTLDAYVTCSLGLPRNLRALDTLEAPTDAPFVDNREMLLASNANVDLLEILGQAREKTYFTDAAAAGESPTVVNPKHLHELSETLDRWAQKYPYFSHSISGDLDSCTKPQLFLNYSRCFALLVLYCPFAHHTTESSAEFNPSAAACAFRCVEAAINAVRTAEVLEARAMLAEAYCLTVDVLAMAATVLLVVELGAPNHKMAKAARQASGTSKRLLEGLALRNSSAAQCLESLTPLYRSTPPATISSSSSAELPAPDVTLFPTDGNKLPALDNDFKMANELYPTITGQFPYADFSSIAASIPGQGIDAINFPPIWPGWGTNDFTVSDLAWMSRHDSLEG